MKKTAILAAAALITLAAGAQEALRGGQQILSPEINPDNTVTFRLLAPGAGSVKVEGDFPGGELTNDGSGLWSFTTAEPLAPELYSYTFSVDGVRTLDPGNVYVNRDIATLSNFFLIDGGPEALYGVADVPHGTVTRLWYDSPALDMKRRMAVYTPPGYEEGTEAYPVFYLLHGAGGDEEAWLALGRAAQIMDNLIARGEAEPMIVVMTNGNAVQSAAPGESADGLVVPAMDISRMNRGDFEKAFPDVVNYIDGHYRTRPEKSGRAIAGLSMGGFHSLHISKQYPDMFDYIGLFSAAIMPPQGSASPIYDDMEGKLKRQFEKAPKLYWIAIGEDDFLYDANVEFRKMLDEGGYPYTYVESDGGHIWRNWRSYLSQFAPLLFK